jgi:hypothetical protein
MQVLSFYDYTGEAVRPWAEAGYQCRIFDIQHTGLEPIERFESGGSIARVHADLYDANTWDELQREYDGVEVAMVLGFPVCTDLAVSGAKHWDKKRQANPQFQKIAVGRAVRIATFARIVDAPFAIENPVGALSTIWRKPDFYFQPCEYGGYIPENQAEHPRYPDYIAPRDAYHKKTGIWCGNGFVKPQANGVKCEPKDRFGMSKQFSKLGGKSLKTKNIRSATPRGFAIAVFQANGEA